VKIKKLSPHVIQTASGLMIVVLAIGSLVYIGKGSANALGSHSEDLRQRWKENGDFVSRLQDNRKTPGVYPPWSYVLGMPFAPPFSFPLVKFWFWVVNCACLFLISYWASKAIPTASIRLRWLAALTCTAIGGNLSAISLGQYSIVTAACLAGGVLLLQRDRPVLPGLLFGFSLVKPQVAILHVGGLIFRNPRRYWRPVVFAGIVIAAASLFAWFWTRTDPVTMFLHAGRAATYWSHPYDRSIYYAGFKYHMDPFLRSIILAAVAVVASSAAAIRLRRASLVDQLAVCSVLSMLLLVHSSYDNIMLAFLAIALMRRAIVANRSVPLVLYLLVGFTLWVPGPPRVNLRGVEYLVWALGALYLIIVPLRLLRNNTEL